MNVLPRSLPARLLLAIAFALALIVALEWTLRSQAQGGPLAVAAARPAAVAVDSSTPLPDYGFWVDTVELCAPSADCTGMAPVWQVSAQGDKVLRVPAPLPTAPGRRRLTTAAIVLPCALLAELRPEQRAALLDLLSALLPERPLAPDRIRLGGAMGRPDDLGPLLRWLR